jgi:hypothetical protein
MADADRMGPVCRACLRAARKQVATGRLVAGALCAPTTLGHWKLVCLCRARHGRQVIGHWDLVITEDYRKRVRE